MEKRFKAGYCTYHFADPSGNGDAFRHGNAMITVAIEQVVGHGSLDIYRGYVNVLAAYPDATRKEKDDERLRKILGL